MDVSRYVEWLKQEGLLSRRIVYEVEATNYDAEFRNHQGHRRLQSRCSRTDLVSNEFRLTLRIAFNF